MQPLQEKKHCPACACPKRVNAEVSVRKSIEHKSSKTYQKDVLI